MQNNCITLNVKFKGVKTNKVKIDENTYTFYGIRKDSRPKYCPHCMKKTKYNIHDYRISKVKFSKFENKSIVLIVKKQRYICKKCKKKITSTLDFVDKNCIISHNVRREITRKLKEMKSLKQIAVEENVSSTTVQRILDNYVIEIPKYDMSTIYFDEFKGNASKEKYQLAIYDKNHKLVTILKDRKSSTIKEFLKKYINEIKLVSIDMFMQFRNVVKNTLPNAEIVSDKYHVVRQANWMIRDVRINLFNNSNEQYKSFKKYWKLIAMSPNSDFSDNQKYRLIQLRSLNENFDKAYELRHKFYNLFNIKDAGNFISDFDNLLEELNTSGIKECIKLGKTLENWKKEITNIIHYDINNGFVEGLNNKIKVIKRVSYGIKKFDNLKKLIQLRIS